MYYRTILQQEWCSTTVAGQIYFIFSFSFLSDACPDWLTQCAHQGCEIYF